MKIETTRRVELTDQENVTLRKAAKILFTLADVLNDDYYEGIANAIEETYLHEPWEVEIEEEEDE